MRNLFILFTLLLLSGCFTKNHKLTNIQISELSSNTEGYKFTTVSYCLQEEVGYSNYWVDFKIVTKNNKTFEGEHTIYGGQQPEEKCFEFKTASFYIGLVGRNSTPDDYKELEEIYKGNIESIDLKIREERSEEVLDHIVLNDL
jgi:hypothetical protein